MDGSDAHGATAGATTVHDVSDDRSPIYAAQAAADFLGIHRSTLYLAVRRLKLIPDGYTPGGHARFRRETLERFSDRLALDSATGGAGGIGRAVASAVASLSHSSALQPVGEAVVQATLAVCPGFDGCMALICDDDSPRGDGLRLLTSHGVSRRLTTEYQWLRRRPGIAFISSEVTHSGEPFICADLCAPDASAPEGGRAALVSAGYRSCAALPCVAGEVTLGALICLGRSPCALSEPEIVALGNLADVLAIALRRERRDAAIERQSRMISALLRESRRPASCPVFVAERIAELRRIFLAGTRARQVQAPLREAAPACCAPSDCAASEPLHELLRVAAREGVAQRAEWREEEGALVALATPAVLGQGAVGALWRRQDMRSGMELAALETFAEACAQIHAQSDRQAQTQAQGWGR